MPLGCCWNQRWPSRQQTNWSTPPASRRACVCSPLQPVCVSLTRVRLWKRLQEGNLIFIGPTRLFSGLLPSLCFMETFVSALVFIHSLERSHCQPASGGFYFLLLLLSVLKLPPGFKAALWGGSAGVAGWQCYHKTVQEMSDCHSASEQLCDCFIAVFPDSSGQAGVDLLRHFCQMLDQIRRVCLLVENWFMLVYVCIQQFLKSNSVSGPFSFFFLILCSKLLSYNY